MGGLILWNASAICDMSETSWADGKTPHDRRCGDPFKGQAPPFEQWLSVTRFQYEIGQDFTNLARKFYQEYSLGTH